MDWEAIIRLYSERFRREQARLENAFLYGVPSTQPLMPTPWLTQYHLHRQKGLDRSAPWDAEAERVFLNLLANVREG